MRNDQDIDNTNPSELEPWISLGDAAVQAIDGAAEAIRTGEVIQFRRPSIEYRGIELSSRYKLEHELKTMRAMVDELYSSERELLPKLVSSIWCDSKAGAAYSVVYNDNPLDILFSQESLEAIASCVADVIEYASGGHNGIYVYKETLFGDLLHERNPDWFEGGAA
jgi:hypothetical protein